MKSKLITRSIYVDVAGGCLVRLLGVRLGSWGTSDEHSCYSVDIRSALYPAALPPEDGAALCQLLEEAGIWFKVADSVVDEVRQRDYPGVAWEYAL